MALYLTNEWHNLIMPKVRRSLIEIKYKLENQIKLRFYGFKILDVKVREKDIEEVLIKIRFEEKDLLLDVIASSSLLEELNFKVIAINQDSMKIWIKISDAPIGAGAKAAGIL